MDYQLFIAVLAVAIAGYTAHLQREQIKIMKAGQESLPGLPRPAPWWRMSPVIAVFALALLTWVPWVWATWITPMSQPQVAVASWGLYDLTNRQLQMTVASARANKDQKFLDVAFHYKGEVDFEDVSELQKSALYDVRVGAQVMIFRYDEKFAAEWASGIKTTSYILLIVPSTVRPEDFSTIRQALSKGAKIVGGGSGPP